MGKADNSDRPRAGGWLVEETIPGSGSKRYFKVYELDKQKAVELARAYGASNSAKAVKELTVHELTGDHMRPGDVKQHG
jgi:ribosomal protein L34E